MITQGERGRQLFPTITAKEEREMIAMARARRKARADWIVTLLTVRNEQQKIKETNEQSIPIA